MDAPCGNLQREARPSPDTREQARPVDGRCSQHRSVSEFVLESALARATEILPDRQRFRLDAGQ
jgi:hypothetical protein